MTSTHEHHHTILSRAATRERLVHHLRSLHRTQDGQYRAIKNLDNLTIEELHALHVQAHKESSK